MPENSSIVYQVSDCYYQYRNHPCLSRLNFQLKKGKMYGLIGPNGSGKTTLINLLNGSRQPTRGKVQLRGTVVHRLPKLDLAKVLSFVPQNVALHFEYSVFEVVMMGRHPFIDRFGTPSQKDIDLVMEAIKTLDIYQLRNRMVTRLSGGERQRVLVARALAQNTEVLVLDEPTASLDVRHSIDIMQALRERVDHDSITVVGAIHDLDLAAAYCDELIVMENGQIAASGSVEDILTSELLQTVFRVHADIVHQSLGNPHIQYRYNNEH
ncbi:ABC transporter ATP-binding protein [Desulfosediminicola sp.]|uniref:ABC transporter ATP-binding protein n=1 Tax=Desulfosediminicola sp. TaxID=2886825 RepID=UPI003AF2AC4F